MGLAHGQNRRNNIGYFIREQVVQIIQYGLDTKMLSELASPIPCSIHENYFAIFPLGKRTQIAAPPSAGTTDHADAIFLFSHVSSLLRSQQFLIYFNTKTRAFR